MAASAFGFLAADRISAEAATIDINVGGAAQDDVAGVAKSIQKVIDNSSPGDTIRFPPGIYSIAKTVVFKSGRDYAGARATLRRVGADGFAACTESDRLAFRPDPIQLAWMVNEAGRLYGPYA